MTEEQIFNGLKEILAMVKPKMDLSKISMDDKLVTTLYIDSLSMLLLSLAIETKFGVQIQSDAKFETVKDVVDYVRTNC